MYERNAIVIDRYFSNIFGYDKKNNIKVNGNNYFELVDILEKYQGASEIENNVMEEYEKIANRIKETQKRQDGLNKKALRYFEKRKNLFDNLDEDEEHLKKEFDEIETEIKINESEIKDNSEKFVQEIQEFNEKSEVRNKCGRERRIIENDYQKILNITIDNFNNILKEKLKQIKSFIKEEDKEQIKNEMKERITKNGAKEKVPFDSNVINKAIDTSLYIEGKKTEILLSIYEKTKKLLEEIRNDTVKIEKHKKHVQDSKSKLEFLNVITDYIILFLDNERMNTIGGEFEHRKIMNEACENLQNDLIEIQNMYSLLVKEINGKTTKKLYKDLYNIEYLNELIEQEHKFEKNISKLNMVGTVIYPDYWRIEGMQKIYETFKNIMKDIYDVDLSEFEPLDITFEVNQNMLDKEPEDFSKKIVEKISKEEINVENKTQAQDSIKEIISKYDTTENEEKSSNEYVKYEKEEDEDDEDDEFHWDEEDEDEELIFDKSTKIIEDEDDEDEEIESVEKQDEKQNEDDDERDKEIDELLGIFDTEDTEEDEPIEEHILQIEDDDELDDSIFQNEDDNVENNKEKNKRKSLFGRRK